MKPSGAIVTVSFALVFAAGCANRHPRTATVIDPPQPLTVPAPPPRVILPPQPEKPNQDLQPADAAGEAAIRQQIGRARQDLKRVHYAGLSSDMKAQYDQANRFLALSEQNLKEHNLLFASTLAEKAGAIAELLTRR